MRLQPGRAMIRAVRYLDPYISKERNRHGRTVTYVRRLNRRIRIRETPGTSAFDRAVADAKDELNKADLPERANAKPGPRGLRTGTLGLLAEEYFGSTEFDQLDRVSQRRRKSIIQECLKELQPNGEPMRDCPLHKFTALKVKALRDAKRALPGAANNRLKYLSAMCGWAIENDKMTRNPCRDVRRLKKSKQGGFHTWTVAEVAQFEEHHPIGTKARLALALLMYLGVRRGDVVRLNAEMIREDVISFVPRKMSYMRDNETHKPILPVLKSVLSKSPFGLENFLETSFGKPFTPAGFGNWFRERCDEAGLPHCSAHGLRKAAATIMAENGATIHQLMAVFDWTNPAQAKPYTDAANRKKLAREAMALIAPRAEAAE